MMLRQAQRQSAMQLRSKATRMISSASSTSPTNSPTTTQPERIKLRQISILWRKPVPIYLPRWMLIKAIVASSLLLFLLGCTPSPPPPVRVATPLPKLDARDEALCPAAVVTADSWKTADSAIRAWLCERARHVNVNASYNAARSRFGAAP